MAQSMHKFEGGGKILGGATERSRGSRAENNFLEHPQGSTTYPWSIMATDSHWAD